MPVAYQPIAARAEIHARIDQLDRDFRKLSVDELCRRVDALRGFARGTGYETVAELSAGLRDELARAGRAAMILPYLGSLRDAATGEPADGRAASIYLAAVGVRLA